MSYPLRQSLADRVRGLREEVAERVTAEFLDRHPDWGQRYGEVARRRGLEDARFHVDFLAGALEAGREEDFQEYGRWTARVLASRGIAPSFLAENLEQVRDALVERLPDEDRPIIAGFIDGACAAVRESDASPDEPAATAGAAPAPDDSTDLGLYLQAVLGGHRATALTVALELLDRGRTVQDVYADLLQPAQYEVGRLWERNEISVAREHMATAVTQFVVAQLFTSIPTAGTRRGNALVSGVEGELHQLGANMVADMLEADGWNVRFLGTQLPHHGILLAIEEHQPTVVGVSATMLFNLPAVSRLVGDIRKHFGSDLRVVVGGSAFAGHRELWREIGADGFGRDLRHGVEVVRSLTDGVGG